MTARFQNLLWLLLTSRLMAGPPQVRASSFPQSLPHLLDKHTPLRAFGRYNDVLAYPTYQASYAIPVRQYRVLPVGFLQCIPHGKPPCHLLTVRGVTPVRKGLPVRPLQPGGAPSGMKLKFHRIKPSGNISCYTLLFNPENLYFQHFFRAFSSVCTCSCWAHTFYKFYGGFCATPTAAFRMLVLSVFGQRFSSQSAT